MLASENSCWNRKLCALSHVLNRQKYTSLFYTTATHMSMWKKKRRGGGSEKIDYKVCGIYICTCSSIIILLLCTRCNNALMVCPQQNPKDTGDCMMAAKAGSIDYKLSANENQFTPFLSKRLELEILTQGHFFCFHAARNSRETEAKHLIHF